jgi:hypothetical protein
MINPKMIYHLRPSRLESPYSYILGDHWAFVVFLQNIKDLDDYAEFINKRIENFPSTYTIPQSRLKECQVGCARLASLLSVTGKKIYFKNVYGLWENFSKHAVLA